MRCEDNNMTWMPAQIDKNIDGILCSPFSTFLRANKLLQKATNLTLKKTKQTQEKQSKNIKRFHCKSFRMWHRTRKTNAVEKVFHFFFFKFIWRQQTVMDSSYRTHLRRIMRTFILWPRWKIMIDHSTGRWCVHFAQSPRAEKRNHFQWNYRDAF